MALPTIDQAREESPDQENKGEKAMITGRRRRFAPLLRGMVVASPLILFAVAALAGLGYYATGNALFSTLAVDLAAAAGFLSIFMAFLLPNS